EAAHDRLDLAAYREIFQCRHHGPRVAFREPTAKPLRIRAAAEGEDNRQRTLPALDVAADGLAGDRGIAPDTEKVIARLERESEGAAELGEALDTVGLAAGDGRSTCHGGLQQRRGLALGHGKVAGSVHVRSVLEGH